ncbi:MAG: thiamine pyrophosphate-binding protein [Rhodospirillales bacterium]
MQSGGHLIVECLKAQGVDRVFCVPGESYLDVLDGLYGAGVDVINARHEGGAAMMAEADGKLTGRPGVCMVTRGPGAANASAGVHVARQDSTPMVLFIGQIERAHRGREAFQEVDFRAFFAPLAKWAEEIETAEQIPEMIARAWRTAMEGRPGPVVLSLPEDMLVEQTDSTPAPRVEPAAAAPAPKDISAFAEMAAAAERPLAVLGGSRWTAADVEKAAAFADAWNWPVAVSFRRQQLCSAEHPHYAGDVGLGLNPALRRRIEQSDLLLLLGGRFSEIPSQGYTLLNIPEPAQPVVHVHPGAEELGRVFRPALAVNAAPGAFLDAVLALSAPPRDAARAKPPTRIIWPGPKPRPRAWAA